MVLRLIGFWLLLTWIAYGSMPKAVEDMIASSQISPSAISIYIKEAGKSGKTIVSFNERVPRKPASVIKIATTYAALLKLGFEYRWKTQVYRSGNIRSGILEGDLVVKGGGDPALNTQDVAKIASYIKAQGIYKISGNIVIDRTKFHVSGESSARFDNYPYSPYNALADAMMFNENTTKLTIAPSGGRFSIKQPFDDRSIKVVNKLTPTNTPCRGQHGWPQINISQTSFPSVVTLQGSLSTRCPQRDHVHIVTRSYHAFYYALRDALQKQGVAVSGGLKFASVPKGAKELFVYHSKPLREIVQVTNKESNNLFARQIFLTLGASVYGEPSTLERSRKAMVDILSQKGVSYAKALQADNGSGLSRSASSTAIAFGSLLDSAYSRYKHEWMEALAIAGFDGTIKRRFPSQRGRVWMKTGSIKGVRNIAGYVRGNSGKIYSVVLLIDSSSQSGTMLQDKLIGWVANDATNVTSQSSIATTKPIVNTPQQIGSYYIQVASVSKTPQREFLQKISYHNFAYELKQTNQGKKLLIGPFTTKSDAQSALPKVRQYLQPDAFIVTW